MSASLKPIKRFTAVDLVTIAVFGAMYRALWYVWNAFNFLFPFNQALNMAFCVMCAIAVLVIVRKVGAATLFMIAAMLINVFLQGESFAVALIGCTNGLLADFYFYIVGKNNNDVWGSFRHMAIASVLTSILVNLNLWITMFKIVYKIPMESALFYSVLAISMVAGVVGGLLGFVLGDKIKGLIG